MLRMMILMLLTSPAVFAADTFSVLLSGHDAPIEGYLRQMSESRYFLQSDGPEGSVTYEIPRSQILTVDGEKEIPESTAGSTKLGEYASFEQILPSGDVVVWTRHMSLSPRGPLTHVIFGAKPHELPRLRETEAFDQFGNQLEVNIDVVEDGLSTVTIPLAVPVGYREEFSLTLKSIRHGAASEQDGVWSYTWNTDFPEDRIYTRKVQLPEGATFVEATHHASPWSDVEPLTVFWRRYCPKLTDDLMTVKYRLP